MLFFTFLHFSHFSHFLHFFKTFSKKSDHSYANIQSNLTSRTSSVTSEKLKSPETEEKPENNDFPTRETEKSPMVNSFLLVPDKNISDKNIPEKTIPEKTSLEKSIPKIITAPETVSKSVPVENYEMPIIESLVETDPLKPSESPESSKPPTNMSSIKTSMSESISNTDKLVHGGFLKKCRRLKHGHLGHF